MVMEVLELHRHGRLLEEAVDQLQRRDRELARSNAALQHFAGQVSHDLKNPLTGVLGFVAMLQEIPTVAYDPDAKRCVDRALSSATRMWRMIEDVLSHAAIGGRPAFSNVPLESTAAAAVDDLTAPIMAAGATVHIGALPTVVGNATQLRVLMQNLVSNSVKFRNPERQCRIEIHGDEHASEWTFAVVDNGVGIPPADRPRVLEMFTRLRSRTSKARALASRRASASSRRTGRRSTSMARRVAVRRSPSPCRNRRRPSSRPWPRPAPAPARPIATTSGK